MSGPSPSREFLDIVREGRSFSGREPHCAFLNLGNGTFCDASSVSGFDFPDDGRALGLVDWDQDGDVDVWMSNRNGPQVRFLRNIGAENHYVSIRLKGTRSNRDGIGARVRLYAGDESKPITRTVSAGSGFLSQNSKWLHFGLGDAKEVDRIEVDWPSGSFQTISVSEVDCRYRVVEDADQVEIVASFQSKVDEFAEMPPALSRLTHDSIRAFSFSMVHLPAQNYTDLAGKRQPINLPGGRSVLVNLWADWCRPCVEELTEFTREADRLRQLGIDVVALSVATSPQSSPTVEAQLLEEIGYPFRAGRADHSTLEKLQMLHDELYELHAPLPIPTSFLLDRQGRVTIIYKGPVTVAQLMSDKRRLAAKTTEQWRKATMEFEGRWFMPPRRRHLFGYVQRLANRGYLDDCRQYVRWNQKMFMTHPDWDRLAKQLQFSSQ